MELTVKICGKDVAMKASASLPLKYRAYFGRDLFADLSRVPVGLRDMSKIDTTVFYNIAWCMAKAADNAIPDLEKWVDSFESFNPFNVYNQIIPLINQTLHTEKN